MTYSEFIKTFGYIIAPLLKGACEWFMNNAKHPIKLSMRSSEPFARVSKMLIEIDDVKYAKMRDWSDVFINRDISKRLNESNISLYCKKQGLKAEYTMCDIGYSDKIMQNMTKSDFAPREFLQMFSANGENYFDRHIRKTYDENIDFYVDFTFDDNQFSVKFDEFFSHYIMHFLPKTYKKHNDASCAEFDFNGNPILIDNNDPFVKDLYYGIYMSLNDGRLTEKESLEFFCNSDLSAIQRAVLMAHNNYNDSPWKHFEPDNLIIRGQDIAAQTFDKMLFYQKRIV